MKDLGNKEGSVGDTYEVGKVIGSGKFAVVKECHHKETGERFAAKHIRKRRSTTSRMGARPEDIDNEVRSLQALNHEHIIKLIDWFDTGSEAILILELVQGGELFDFISTREALTEEEATVFIKQMLKAVKAMHSVSIVHLDLKPENVMLESKDSKTIKIIDFGISRQLNPGEEIRDMIGTPEFVAPEIINYEPIEFASDMWSIGVVTYVMLSGASPFLGNTYQETYEKVSLVEYCLDNDYFSDTSDLAKDFINRLLVRNPKHRMTAEEALNHPWIEPRQESQRQLKRISSVRTENLRSFIARKRWKHSFRVIRLCNELIRKHTTRRVSSVLTDQPANQTVGCLKLEELAHTLYPDVEGCYTLTGLSIALDLPRYSPNRTQNIKLLLAKLSAWDVDLNTLDSTGVGLVHRAAQYDQTEVFEQLKDADCDLMLPNAEGNRAVDISIRNGCFKILEYFTKLGLLDLNHQNKAGETCLHHACKFGHAHIIKYICTHTKSELPTHDKPETDEENNMMVKKPRDEVRALNITDQFGDSALHTAVWNDNVKIVEQLIQAGSNINTQNKDGDTALHVACSRNNSQLVNIFLKSGANINLRNAEGESPFLLPRTIKSELVWILLSHRLTNQNATQSTIQNATDRKLTNQNAADLELTNNTGDSLLHLSSRLGIVDLAEYLLKKGVCFNLPNKDGLTPLSLAVLHQHLEIVRLLVIAGSRLTQSLLCSSQANHAPSSNNHTLTGSRTPCSNHHPPSNHTPSGNRASSSDSETSSKQAEQIDDLLKRCADPINRTKYLDQLKPISNQKLRRLSLTLLGSQGSGKTSLMQSLSAGYMARASSFIKQLTNTYYSGNNKDHPAQTKSVSWSTHSKHIRTHKVSLPGGHNFICVELPDNDEYTHVYDTLIGQIMSVHIVTFKVSDCDGENSMAENEIRKWLDALLMRLKHPDVIYDRGENGSCLPVMLVGTYVDKSSELHITEAHRLYEKIRQSYGSDLAICGQLFLINATSPHSHPIKSFKNYLRELKGHLESDLAEQAAFTQVLSNTLTDWSVDSPAYYLSELHIMVREQMNPLITDKTLSQALLQLEMESQIIILHSDGLDSLVIISSDWLYSSVFRNIFSQSFRTLCPVSGFLPADQLSALLPEVDYEISSATLCYLNMASSFDINGTSGLEFTSLNFLPKPSLNLPSNRADITLTLSLHTDECIMRVVFFRSLISLRKLFLLERSHAPESDDSTRFYVYMNGAEYTQAGCKLYVTLENNQVQVQATGGIGKIPELMTEYLSLIKYHLMKFCPIVRLTTMLTQGTNAPIKDTELFKSNHLLATVREITSNTVILAPDYPIAELPTNVRRLLARALDRPDELGRGWCLLAMKLRLEESVPKIETDCEPKKLSKTDALLKRWVEEKPHITVGELYRQITDLGRTDCADILQHHISFMSTLDTVNSDH